MKRTVFRVVYDSAEENIWRDIAITKETHLEELHSTIIAAFNLEQGQMGSYYVSNEHWDQLDEVPQFAMEKDTKTMVDWTIESINQKDRFLYVYDFMRMYTFYVEVLDEDEGDLPIELLVEKGEVPAKEVEVEMPEDAEPNYEDVLKELDAENFDDPMIDSDVDINDL